MVVAPYFFVDESNHPDRTGPFVLPVAREVDRTVTFARASVEQLLAGPTPEELLGVPSITTMIPAGTRLLGLNVREDIATIDLSSEFGATDASPVVAQRAAQVVFTLARFDSVVRSCFVKRENRSPDRRWQSPPSPGRDPRLPRVRCGSLCRDPDPRWAGRQPDEGHRLRGRLRGHLPVCADR